MSIGLGVYFLRRLEDRQTSQRAITAYYVLTFTGGVLMMIVLGLFFEGTVSFLPSAMFLVGIPMWIASLAYLLMNLSRSRRQTENPLGHYHPGVPYILPFALYFLSVSMPSLILVVRTAIDWFL